MNAATTAQPAHDFPFEIVDVRLSAPRILMAIAIGLLSLYVGSRFGSSVILLGIALQLYEGGPGWLFMLGLTALAASGITLGLLVIYRAPAWMVQAETAKRIQVIFCRSARCTADHEPFGEWLTVHGVAAGSCALVGASLGLIAGMFQGVAMWPDIISEFLDLSHKLSQARG